MTETASTEQPAPTLHKTMRWYDGFAMSLTMPAALIASLGASIVGLGGWGAVLLWTISMLLATVANWIYTELAAMFPDTSGGIAAYAAEAWKERAPIVGPLAAVGYWFPWTTALSVYAGIIGALVQSQWFPDQDWSISLGPIGLDFPIMVGLMVIGILYVLNIVGVRITMTFVYITGGILLIPLAVFIIGPLITGGFHISELTWNLHGIEGLRTSLVWLYVMAWTSFGVEVCATFAPEYRNTVSDTAKALKAGVLFSLGVFVLLPLILTGYVGEAAIAEAPTTFYVSAFQDLVGGAADVMVLFLICSLLLIMVTGLADGSRVLYNMGKEGTSIRQVGVLNSRGIPVRALTVALVVNVLVLTVLKTPLAIIVTGNLGYILAHIFALSGFFLLRKDRPDLARPIRLPAVFVPLSLALAAVLVVILVVGATGFEVTGYGGFKELAVALGVLALGVVLWLYRRKVQDRGEVTEQAVS
ncbi:amino acid transporter [Rhodococcus sp. PvR044]|jgi:amino acid transporter|uniref:APC family permease n=1 Tax=Rhodococcus TaxID=1827 RepID=UPI000BD666C8|nr:MULTISPECIES: APC family permease [Rhodococcus]MCZ4558999.1 APC family permease [Rhodococcus maanshanensis]PTR33815.1 amino acid/polyamine/organocation transporter (APC superfamily) [Rhodococcus sp. OK611]SNX94204.1 amino acid/polyamine/organocation transporter, APC superfamily [Rhodococcus sp. OK270]